MSIPVVGDSSCKGPRDTGYDYAYSYLRSNEGCPHSKCENYHRCRERRQLIYIGMSLLRQCCVRLNLLCQAAAQNRSPKARGRSSQSRRKISSDSRRLSERSASRRVLPRASRFAMYVLPRPSSRAWMMAIR